MPPLLVPADCGTIHLRNRARGIMRASHAVSQGSNWTRLSNPTPHTPKGPSSQPAPPCGGTLAAGTRVLAPLVARAATAVVCAHPARLRQSTSCPCTPNSACEALTRGDLRRARHREPDEALFGYGVTHADE